MGLDPRPVLDTIVNVNRFVRLRGNSRRGLGGGHASRDLEELLWHRSRELPGE